MIPLMLILATPSACRADLGGPLLVEVTGFEKAAAAHFLVGNLLLGCLEAFLLTSWFKTPNRRTFGLMIAANYLSAIAYFPLAGILGSVFSIDALVAALGIALLFTVIIEAPFVLLCFPDDAVETKRWMTAHALVQVLSYSLLVGFYLVLPFLVSDIEIQTKRQRGYRPIGPTFQYTP
jgi:hypothetical protein